MLKLKLHERAHRKTIKNSTIYVNGLNSLIEQTKLYDVMYKHMNLEREDGKTPKLLLIGLDGVRADLLPRYLTGSKEDGISEVIKDGGALYLGRAGGSKKKEQRTLTGPGWTTLFTGTWCNEHKVKGTRETSVLPTIIRTFSEQGFNTIFSATFHKFFEIFWKNDCKALPDVFCRAETDIGVMRYMLDAINGSGDAIFGVLDRNDGTGHSSGYIAKDGSAYVNAFRENNASARMLVDAAKARPTYNQEDWLIVITTDHGGYRKTHGTMFQENTLWATTFFAVNKKVF
jgi:predicted AlkP superfamily pyrophosphatase or phosphodiesterase